MLFRVNLHGAYNVHTGRVIYHICCLSNQLKTSEWHNGN